VTSAEVFSQRMFLYRRSYRSECRY